MAASGEGQKLKVFISYSRRDLAFADRLVDALEQNDFVVRIDRRDLPYGEEWQKELGDFIRESDTVVWLVSPDSIISDWCNWELGLVGDLKKRLIPIKIRDIDLATLPKAIGKIHLLPAEGLFTTDQHLAELVETLNTDRAWLKDATRLGDRARQWSAKKRDSGLLLRGGALRDAEEWEHRQPAKAPSPAGEVLELILASRQAATRRQRYWVGGSLAIAVGAIALAGLAYFQREIAFENEKTANKNLEEAQITQTLFWGDLAKQQLDEGDATTAALLALEGFRDPENGKPRPFRPEPVQHLYRGLHATPEVGLFQGHTDYAGDVSYSADGKRLLSASNDRTARIWDTGTRKPIVALSGHTGAVYVARFAADDTRVVTSSHDGTVRIWDSNSGAQIASLQVKKGDNKHLDVSPDGRSIVTASGDKFAVCWDVLTGERTAILEGHTSTVFDARYSPDGTRIVTTGIDKTVRIWEAHSGREITKLEGHRESINEAVFDPSGQFIASASDDHTARIWSVATGQSVHVLRGHDQFVKHVRFSPDGTRVLTGSWDLTARVWDATTGAEIAKFSEHKQPLIGVYFVPDGRHVLSIAGSDYSARMWDLETGRQRAVFRVDGGVPVSVGFSPDGGQLVTAVYDTLYVWKPSGGGQGGRLPVHGTEFKHESVVGGAIFSPDGHRFVTRSMDGAARLWDTDSGRLIATLEGHPNEVIAVDFSPDGRRIVTVSHSENLARVWDGNGGSLIGTVQKENASRYHNVNDARFSPDGRWLVTAESDDSARIWNARSLQLVKTLPGHIARAHLVEFAPDSRRLITATNKGEAYIWDVETGAEIALLKGHEDRVNSIDFSSDGARIVTASSDLTVRVWDASNGRQLLLLKGHRPGRYDKLRRSMKLNVRMGVVEALFSPDDAMIVTAADDHTIRLWDAQTGKQIAVLDGHVNPVEDVSFNAAGTQILSASQDGTAAIWDIKTRRRIAILGPHTGGVTSASFSPDGTRVITSSALYDDRGRSRSGGAFLWNVFKDTPSLIAAAKGRLTRCLTQEQRKRFFMPPQPPRWCITGGGLEGETDTSKWRPKYPYHTDAWREWLVAKDRGEDPPMPKR